MKKTKTLVDILSSPKHGIFKSKTETSLKISQGIVKVDGSIIIDPDFTVSEESEITIGKRLIKVED